MEEIRHQELVNYKLEQISVRLDKIDHKLDDGVSRAEHEAVLKRIGDLEDTNKWLNRTVLAVIIVALLGTIIITR